MKPKRLTFLSLALSALLLSACFGAAPSLEDRIRDADTEGKVYSYTGMIEPAVFDAYQPGTHLLKMEGDDPLLLQSALVDLNRYLDEEVILSGTNAKVIGNAKRVLNVTEIKYADETRNDETAAYENKTLGFRFKYPAAWKLSEEGGVQFTAGEGGEEVVMAEIKTYDETEDMDALTVEEEEGNGTAVTIGAQRALRFSDNIFFHVYIPNPPQRKVYRISFPPFTSSDERARQPFYDLLRSFELIYASTAKGEMCGGLKKVECAEGYRCELESAGKYAEGTCVSLTPDPSAGNCPFIATPSCSEYRIAEYTKAGCPSRYECVQDGGTLEEPAPAEDDGEDMVMADGMEDVPSAQDVVREYRDIRQEFTMKYPKGWYYASFGAIDGTFLTVGFADKALEEPEDAIITVRLMDAVPNRAPEGRFFLSTRRDLNSFFVVEGTPELKEMISAMLKSIVDERE